MGSIADDAVDWRPGQFLQEKHVQARDGIEPFALVILNQPLRDLQTLRRLWNNSSLRVAADGGANMLYQVRSRVADASLDALDVIIGDLDSLRDDVRDHYTSLAEPSRVIHDPDQYSTDFGKAIKYIRSTRSEAGPIDIVAMGGLGGRVDQGLSQLHHLYLFQRDPGYAGGRLFLISGESVTFLLKEGKHRIRVREGGAGVREGIFGKHVGIIPVGAPSVITTKGLEWDITDWETEFGGQMSTSNHVLPETQVVEVQTSGDVLFTIALRRDEDA